MYSPRLHRAMGLDAAAIRVPVSRVAVQHHRAGHRSARATPARLLRGAHRKRPGQGRYEATPDETGVRPFAGDHGMTGDKNELTSLRAWTTAALVAAIVILAAVPLSLLRPRLGNGPGAAMQAPPALRGG